MQEGFGGQVCFFKGVKCLFAQVKGWKWDVCLPGGECDGPL